MQNEPLVIAVMTVIGVYVTKLWWDDYRLAAAGRANPNALPGAMPAPPRAIAIAALGGIVILAGETAGEHILGLTSQQTNMTGLFAIYTLTAAIIEEIIFRGYFVLDRRSPFALWAGIIGASLVFAGLHPFLWQWEGGLPWSDGRLTWHFTTKGWFSTGSIFAGSLWFYVVRFAKFNPKQSLLPCFAAHAAKNLGVIAIKATEGFLHGLY